MVLMLLGSALLAVLAIVFADAMGVHPLILVVVGLFLTAFADLIRRRRRTGSVLWE